MLQPRRPPNSLSKITPRRGVARTEPRRSKPIDRLVGAAWPIAPEPDRRERAGARISPRSTSSVTGSAADSPRAPAPRLGSARSRRWLEERLDELLAKSAAADGGAAPSSGKNPVRRRFWTQQIDLGDHRRLRAHLRGGPPNPTDKDVSQRIWNRGTATRSRSRSKTRCAFVQEEMNSTPPSPLETSARPSRRQSTEIRIAWRQSRAMTLIRVRKRAAVDLQTRTLPQRQWRRQHAGHGRRSTAGVGVVPLLCRATIFAGLLDQPIRCAGSLRKRETRSGGHRRG